jgi:hypothetical protein
MYEGAVEFVGGQRDIKAGEGLIYDVLFQA